MHKRAEDVAKQLNEFRQMSTELGQALSLESKLRQEAETAVQVNAINMAEVHFRSSLSLFPLSITNVLYFSPSPSLTSSYLLPFPLTRALLLSPSMAIASSYL